MKSVEERAESRETRELRKQISKLKSEVRQLRKSLKQYERDVDDGEYRAELELEVRALENTIEDHGKKSEKKSPKCPHCGSDDYVVFEVVGRPYAKCHYEGCLKKGFLDKK